MNSDSNESDECEELNDKVLARECIAQTRAAQRPARAASTRAKRAIQEGAAESSGIADYHKKPELLYERQVHR